MGGEVAKVLDKGSKTVYAQRDPGAGCA